MKIRKVLAEKIGRGHNSIYKIGDDVSLRAAARRMCAEGVGAMLVTKEGGSEGFVGVLSERDLLKACAEEFDFDTVPVKRVMTADVVVASLDDDVQHVVEIMGRRHIRHIPLVDDDGKIIGFLSVRDLIRSIMTEDEIRIRHLSDYLGASHHNQVY